MTESVNYFGLTGGIACGKSTAAAFFGELGALIVDADQIAHELIQPSGPADQEVIQAFGTSIVNARGEIDRQRLGALVFSEAGKLQRLNAILHPRIILGVEEQAAAFRAADPKAVVLVDAALIFESGIGGRFTKIIVAWCPPEQQVERLMAKGGFSREEAEQRIQTQMPAEEKRRRADFVIDTSGPVESTRQQVKALYPRLQRLAEE
jgi:dephospho-CoA kinase